jgi:hypothetical protein
VEQIPYPDNPLSIADASPHPYKRHGADFYPPSSQYEGDLATTCRVWSAPDVMETAGTIAMLTYFSLPNLLAVQSGTDAGALRIRVDGLRERVFLEGMVGLAADPSLRGGIRNPEVRTGMQLLRQRHCDYPGMLNEHMSFVGGLLAIAPFRTGLLSWPDHEALRSYWRYMSNAMNVLGIDLPETIHETERACDSFVRAHADRCELGDVLISYYRSRHPTHVTRALPALFPDTATVVNGVPVPDDY